MRMKHTAVPAVLALALSSAFAPAAFAQTMVGSQSVADADRPAVVEKCQDLATQSNAGMAPSTPAAPGMGDASGGMSDAGATTGAMATAEGTGTSGAPDTSATSPATTAPGGLDLQAITLAECEAAGLTGADAQ